jgi:hypothetical protein
MRYARLEVISMSNQQQYLASPEDEDAVRVEIREKCAGRFQSPKMNEFFDESVGPAFDMFLRLFKEIIGPEVDYFEIDLDGKGFHYHESELGVDIYGARTIGARVTTNEWLFYYYVYAMSIPGTPFGTYCVFIKSDGKYRFLMNLDACSQDALFEDVKRSFLKAKAQLQS